MAVKTNVGDYVKIEPVSLQIDDGAMQSNLDTDEINY